MSDSVHVYPLNDLHEHNTDGDDCPCHPRIEIVNDDQGHYKGRIIKHNSYDGRELIERKCEIAGPQ
jgi:hypothetical protein